MSNKMTSEELNRDFERSKTVDEEVFAEQKSNLLLVSGEHYKQTEKKQRELLRDSSIPAKQKVKITKNHTKKIIDREVNGVAALAADVKCSPANPSELKDKKAAELYQAVKKFGDKRYKLKARKEQWTEDLCQIGEVVGLVRWDTSKGDLVGYEQKVDDEGTPLFMTENGEMTPATGVPEIDTQLKEAPDMARPIFSGDFVFDRIYAFNLHRDPEAADMDDSPYLIIDKMADIDDVKAMVAKDDPKRADKLTYIQKSADTTFRVFDTNKLDFDDVKGKVHLRYHYFRPGIKYPNGYYYICTSFGIIHDDELPFGIWPIAFAGHTRMATAPRFRCRIKTIRPYQIEINRASSQRIHHQLTHGDDKIFTRPGMKTTSEATLPGIRAFKAFGEVQIIPGRTGDQFAGYVTEMIQELYQVCEEDLNEDGSQPLDPVALLYSSVKRSKKYGKQAATLVQFLQDIYMIYFKLAKHYFDETRFIQAAGRSEGINIAEFKAADDVSVQITVEASSENADDMLGRYLFTQNALQYVGKDLPKETVGRILSNMPFANSEQILGPMMLNYKNVENDILALDRGEQRPAEPDDDHKLYIMELTSRIKSPDFKSLDPMIQQGYMDKREGHRQFEAQAVQQMLLAEREAIPMDGNFVKVDMYEMNENGKQERATFPDGSLKWLRAKLDQQGMTQDRLKVMAPADQLAIAQGAVQGLNPQQPQMNNQGGLNGNGQQPQPGF